MDILKCHNHSLHIMRCIYRFGMYAAHALYKRAPYAIESHWPPRVRGMYAVHTPFAPWIRHGQVLVRDIICSGIAIHTPYAPHVRHPCAIDMQLIRNTCEIVAPEMFHQTISAILLRICSFFRTLYKRCAIAGQWNRGIRLKSSWEFLKQSPEHKLEWCFNSVESENSKQYRYKRGEFSHKYPQKTPHSSPVRARYGVSFEGPALDWYCAWLPKIIYAISCYTGPCYSGTWL